MSKSGTALAERPVKPSATPLAKFANAITEIESIVEESNLAGPQMKGRFGRMMVLSSAVNRLGDLITPDMMKEIMPLQGSQLGFRTDKDTSGGYPAETVKQCLIAALLMGVYPVGNEFNIIANRTYITKEGMERKVREVPGLTDLKLNFGVPLMKNGGAVIKCSGSWRLDGKADLLEAEIPIRTNQGMIVDAIIGKATRKLLARIFQRLTGSDQLVVEADADEPGASPEEIIAADGSSVIGTGEEGDQDDEGGIGIVTVGNVVHQFIEEQHADWTAEQRSKAIEKWCKAGEIDPQILAAESDGSEESNAIIDKARGANWELYGPRK